MIFSPLELNVDIPKEKNLAYKAANLFFEQTGIQSGCEIKINKNIPLQAGLGGGSSNAATVLKGLNKIFGNKLIDKELLQLAQNIGSDVPFFLVGGTCFAREKGDILQILENNLNLEVKIIKPSEISISTSWAYKQIDAREFINDHEREIKNLISAMKSKNHELFFKNTFNDFETVIFSYYPKLIRVRQQLLEEGYKTVGLCGSGSAIYGLRYR